MKYFKIVFFTITLSILIGCGGGSSNNASTEDAGTTNTPNNLSTDDENSIDSTDNNLSINDINTTDNPKPIIPNTAPSIEGTAKITTNIYDMYQFLPTSNDINQDTLTFSITNKPAWADFNTTTGLLSGVVPVGSEGNYTDINISVSDETETVSLAPFSIEVKEARNIAKKFGKATQPERNGYYYYKAPKNAIDGNLSTHNHTQCSAPNNWLQIELPKATKVEKIVLHNVSGQEARLNGTTVYLSNANYTGSEEVNNNEALATLNSNMIQTIEPSNSSESQYLLIKGNPEGTDSCLHLTEVEVYGITPPAPTFNTYADSYLISGTIASGTIITTLSAFDYQGDTLTYSIVGDVPFSVDSNGNVSVNGTLAGAVYSFDVVVSDGGNSVSTPLTIQATSANAVEEAISSGSVLNITEEELIQATLDEIETSKNLLRDAKIKIFNLKSDGTAKDDDSSLTAIDWNPTHDSSLFLSILGKNTSLLVTNAVAQEGKSIYKKEIGIIGEKGTARYMLMGANPLRVLGNEQMEQVLENSMAWLTGKENLKTAPFSVVIAHLDESYWSQDESKTRLWLDTHYAGQVSYNIADSCDGTALAGCLANSTDLLIISQLSTDSDDVKGIALTVNQALENGTSVLYIHQDGNQKTLGKELFSSVFNVIYIWDNFDKKLSVDDYNPIADLNVLSEDLIKMKTMFRHFKNKDYSFDWSLCEDAEGVQGENKDKCHNVAGLSTEFQDAASVIRTMFNQFDSNKKDIFLEEGYRLQKLLALTSDKFRQTISFPMDKVTSDNNDFMKSYYSDHAVYNYRKVNPAQADMGNFSRSDFSHITPITKTVHLNSKKRFRSVGLYALPGQTVKVTRNDSSDVSVKVFINTLRSGSTHQYQRNGYNRPKYLQTPHFEIKSGESIEFTSPYGGPLQLEFNTNDLPVELKFENVGEHAYWASSADDASFAQKLQASEYDWAEVATAGFEVHSKLDKMIQSVENDRWGGTAAGLAAAVVKYTSNYPHVLAGFKGDGVDVVPEIHDWANTNGLTIETIDTMKHMNADQATCGYGCSGNPYDAYWAFDPIGHGDIHELGHSLQKKDFEGFPGHAATNTFSYYTKSKYFDNTGEDGNCGGLPFKSLFTTIQSSVGESNVTEYLKTNLWDEAGLGEQYLLKIEAMMHAQKLGKLENGWHVLARVHILEREKGRAKADWDARKASIGFSTYALGEFNSIRDNDWLVVSYSYAATLDYRNYFDMMGIPYSQKARDQIASFGFDVPPNALFVSTDKGYCKTDEYGTLFDRPTLDMDGNTSYAY